MTRSSIVAVGLSLFVSILAAQDRDIVSAATVSVDPFTVAVLPIENLTREDRGPELATEIYKALIEQLSAVEGLYVLGEESTKGFSETGWSSAEIAQNLGAANVISGEIYVAEGGFHASLNLSDVQNYSGLSTYGLIVGFEAAYSSGDPLASEDETSEASSEDNYRYLIAGLIESIRRDLNPPPLPNSEQARAENRAIVLDANLSDRERRNALQALTPYHGPIGRNFNGDPVSNDVVVAAVQLAMESADADVRRGVWRAMRRVEDPYLIQPLLAVLQSDLDEHVRAEAARALRNFVYDPEVLQSLIHASVHDESKLAREAASFAMQSDSEQLRTYAVTILDESKEASVRSRALYNLRWSTDDEEWLEPDVLAAAVDLARSATKAETRGLVWSVIGDDLTGSLKEPLLEAIADDPDPQVRAETIRYIWKYRDEPSVVASLEEALSGESSPYVRKRLEETLASTRDQRR